MPEKVPGKLFFRSFGATFTAHAIGTIIWSYTIPMTGGAMFFAGLLAVIFINSGKVLTRKEGVYLLIFYRLYWVTEVVVSKFL